MANHVTGSGGNVPLTSGQSGVATIQVTDQSDGTNTFRSRTIRNTHTPFDDPDAPTGLSVASQAAGSVTLTDWTDGDDGGSPITRYDAQWRVRNTTPWTGSREGVDRGEVISGLTNNVEYEFQVRAVNAGGAGDYSASAFATIDVATIVGIGTLNLRFDWADPELPADLIMTRSYIINEALFNNDRYLADAFSAVPANGVAITDGQGRPVSLPLREGWIVVGGPSGPMALEVPRFGVWRLGTVSGSPAWVEVEE